MALSPQRKKILEALAMENAPIHHTDLGKPLGITRDTIKNQMAILEKDGHVESTDKNVWSITAAGLEALKEDAANLPLGDHPSALKEGAPTMVEAGMTPRQIFTNYGINIGISQPKIPVICEMVWTGNPYDLNWVWKKLIEANIPFDLRKFWISAWKAYVSQEYPEWENWEPPTGAHEKAKSVAEEEAEKKAAKAEPREYLIGASNQVVKVGPVAGMYTFEEAQGLASLNLLKQQADAAVKEAEAGSKDKISEILAALAPYVAKEKAVGEGGTEKVSEILTALAPYITKETGGDNAIFKELIETKLEAVLKEFESRLPGPQKPWYETLPAMIAAITSAAPTLRAVLGVPDTDELMRRMEAKFPQGQSQPYQILDSEGKPMVMDLKTILEVRKFDSDQKRDDEKHKASMDMMSGMREFVTKIGSAASRMAGTR